MLNKEIHIKQEITTTGFLFKICAASMEDLNNKIGELESKVTSQVNEIESHLEAIVQLENQKLDLTQGNIEDTKNNFLISSI